MARKKKPTKLYCCGCVDMVKPRLTDGSEIYPHRNDLYKIPFWICDACKNYVGCHHKTSNPTQPLGCIPTKEIRSARGKIHSFIDPIWKSGSITRGQLYEEISERVGRKFHASNIRSIDEARDVYRAAIEIKREMKQ